MLKELGYVPMYRISHFITYLFIFNHQGKEHAGSFNTHNWWLLTCEYRYLRLSLACEKVMGWTQTLIL